MSRFNTGNPIDSSDFKDLSDNAKNIDQIVNSYQDTFKDRLGNERLTWTGVQKSSSGDPSIAVAAASDALRYASAAEGFADDAKVSSSSASASAGDAHNTLNQVLSIRDGIITQLSASEIKLYDDPQKGFNATPMDGYFSVYDENGIITTFKKVGPQSYTKIADNMTSNYKIAETELSSNFDSIKNNGWHRSPNTNDDFPGKPPQLKSLGNLLLFHQEGLNGRATQICMNTTGGSNSMLLFRSKGADMIYGDWKDVLSGIKSVSNEHLADSQQVNNFDTITDNGWYRGPNTNSDFPGKPPQLRTVGNLMLLHLQGLGLRATQICMNTTGADNAVMLYRSKGSAGVYGDWKGSGLSIDSGGSIDSGVYLDGDTLKNHRERSDFYTLAYNSIYTTSQDLNNHYKRLVSDFPDYVSEELLGEDDFGNEIWEFTFAAKRFRYVAPATPTNNAHPKFVVVSGTHGSERAAAVSTLCFFDDLCRKWDQDERLSDLRWGAEIVLIACLNPWGVNNGNKRRNGNDVDFNHNFPNGWDDLVSEYKGPNPLSEPETRIANSLPERHPTANVMIDFHGHENNYLTWIGTRSHDGFSTQKHVLRKHGSWLYRNFLKGKDNTSLMASTGTTPTGLATAWTLAGRQGFLLECGIQWPGFNATKIRMIGVDALTTLIYESWLKESSETGWITEPPTEGNK